MAGTTGINVIVAQGNTVTEVQNIRKQVLELGQQIIAQKSEEKKKEDKAKVAAFQEGDKIEIRTEGERRQGRGQEKKDGKNEPSESDQNPAVSPSGALIDIKV
jgi:hypothetical protein